MASKFFCLFALLCVADLGLTRVIRSTSEDTTMTTTTELPLFPEGRALFGIGGLVPSGPAIVDNPSVAYVVPTTNTAVVNPGFPHNTVVGSTNPTGVYPAGVVYPPGVYPAGVAYPAQPTNVVVVPTVVNPTHKPTIVDTIADGLIKATTGVIGAAAAVENTKLHLANNASFGILGTVTDGALGHQRG